MADTFQDLSDEKLETVNCLQMGPVVGEISNTCRGTAERWKEVLRMESSFQVYKEGRVGLDHADEGVTKY